MLFVAGNLCERLGVLPLDRHVPERCLVSIVDNYGERTGVYEDWLHSGSCDQASLRV